MEVLSQAPANNCSNFILMDDKLFFEESPGHTREIQDRRGRIGGFGQITR